MLFLKIFKIERIIFLFELIKSNFIFLFISITWLSLLFSINTHPTDVNKIFNNPMNFINALRFIFGILMSLISIVLLIYFLITQKINKFSNLSILFILYFIFQVIGLINNELREFNIDNTYLIIFSLGAISSLIILFNEKNNEYINFIFLISVVLLTLVFLIIFFSLNNFFETAINQGSLYYLYHPHFTFMDQSLPRVTGATRSFAITALALLLIFFIPKKYKIINITIFFFFIIYSIIIWIGQSRGSLLCYYLTSLVLILFLNNLSITKKLSLYLSITILSIFLSDLFIKLYNSKVTKFSDDNIEIQSTDKDKVERNAYKFSDDNIEIQSTDKDKVESNAYKFSETRIISYKGGTSGRTTLWLESYNAYDKEKIFGYGPQGDRFILNNFNNVYSNNSSNLIVYGFLSGGYFSFLLLIILYFYILLLMIKFILRNKILNKRYVINKENLTYTFSLLLVIFFSIRSIFENSYGLFSIDFLFMTLSLYALEHYNKKIN